MKPVFVYNYKHSVVKKQQEFYDLFMEGGGNLEAMFVKEHNSDHDNHGSDPVASSHNKKNLNASNNSKSRK
jgi:hypothetical protein